jgi:hypothetical protein
MTDRQLLVSIRLRAAKRLSNFPLIKILNELEKHAQGRLLERPVMDKLLVLCKIYHINLDEFDMEHVNSPRADCISEEARKRLRSVGVDL